MNYSKKSKEELIEEIELLKRKEENISKILYNINEMFYKISFDKDGTKNIDYISPQVENVLGLTTEEYIKNKDILFEHFHPEEIEDLIVATKRINKEKKQWSFTYRFYHKILKKYVWIEETIIPVFDKKGKRTGLLGTAKDVTENKTRENQLSFILKNIDECIYSVKFEKGKKTLNYISTTVEKLTGLSSQEFAREGSNGNLVKRIHPEDVDRINRHIEDGLYAKKKKQLRTSFRFKPKGSKKYLWLEETVHTTYDVEGNIAETTTVLRDITKSKTIELHLKENEEKYRNIFTRNLAGVFITEKNTIIDCNNSFAKIFGYKSRVQLIGKKAQNLYFTKKERDNYLNDLKKKKSLSNYRIRHKKADGTELWILTNVSMDDNDRIEGTLVDITEQINIEKKLKQSEENYKDLTENSPYGIFVHINGKIIYSNSKSYEIWGLKSNSKKAKNLVLKDFILEENIKEANKRTNQALAGKEVPFKEFRIKKPFSNEFIDVETKPILFNLQGKKAIQVVFRDITLEKELSKEKLKLKIAEESNRILQQEIDVRKKVERQLEENQKYTKSIIESSLDVICASDVDGNVIEMNKSGLQTFEYKEKDIINKKAKILYSDAKQFLKVSRQLQKTGSYIGEIENVRSSGEKFTSFLSASLLYDQEGKEIGSMGVSRDITELKEAEKQLIESEEKYRDLFENATDLIQSVDVKGNILYVNDSWKKTLGYTENEIKGKNIFEFIHPECMDKCQTFFADLMLSKENETIRTSYELKTKKGEKITVEGNVSLKYQDKIPHSTRAILRDITKEKWEQTKQQVYNNVAKIITEKIVSDDIYESIRLELGKIIDTSIFSISYVLDKEVLDFTYYYDITRKGRIYPEKRYKEQGINEYIIKKAKPKIIYKEEWNKIIKKGPYKLYGPKAEVFVGVPLKIKNKVIGVVAVQSYENRNALDEKAIEILEFISTALALTVQRKYDETKIYDQSARLESIIENSTHLFWTFNKNLGLTTFNKNFDNYVKESYGKIAETNLHKKNKKTRVSSKEEEKFWDEKYNNTYKGKQQHFITDKKDKRGQRIIKEVFLNPIKNDTGEIIEVSGIAHDITEKTIAEEQLKESLQEKEVLLKEVHHRVKNNLQVISSILNLQSSYVKEQSTLNILKESQNRIKSMAFIHESLYQTTDFSQINFSEYVITLSQNLVHSYGVFDNFVKLDLQVKDISLNLDQSIPCGLLINELVSNALKYAFPEREKGTITIELYEKNEEVFLKVSDNGIGLPKNINYRDTESLGLQLVMTLTEQINGTIELDNTSGASYSIRFKKEE